jgi:hypothetical protein
LYADDWFLAIHIADGCGLVNRLAEDPNVDRLYDEGIRRAADW